MKIMDEQKIWKGKEYCNVFGSQEVDGSIPFSSTKGEVRSYEMVSSSCCPFIVVGYLLSTSLTFLNNSVGETGFKIKLNPLSRIPLLWITFAV